MSDLHLYTAPKGLKGFDCNFVLTDDALSYFLNRGMKFVLRYVRRDEFHAYDLSVVESARILEAGLGLALAQHVAPDNWLPSATKGIRYASTAKLELGRLGMPPGTMVVLDLEMVDPHVSPTLVIDYCNSWHAVVAGDGYLPCLYVGWNCGLSSEQLYNALRFTHYWGAANAQVAPKKRGFQLRQFEQHDTPFGKIDPDEVLVDTLGGAPVFLAKDGWLDA